VEIVLTSEYFVKTLINSVVNSRRLLLKYRISIAPNNPATKPRPVEKSKRFVFLKLLKARAIATQAITSKTIMYLIRNAKEKEIPATA
jgi:hypothetical protein